MKFIHLKQLEHSGSGKDAIHIKVMAEFEKSEAQGTAYCKARCWEVSITDILLTVSSKAMYGFRMSALIIR